MPKHSRKRRKATQHRDTPGRDTAPSPGPESGGNIMSSSSEGRLAAAGAISDAGEGVDAMNQLPQAKRPRPHREQPPLGAAEVVQQQQQRASVPLLALNGAGSVELGECRAPSPPQQQAQGRQPAQSDARKRRVLFYPRGSRLSLEQKHTWYMALLRQHPESNVTFREGRNAPYLTLDDGPVHAMLVSEGFQGVVMEAAETHHRVVVIHAVPLCVEAAALPLPHGFVWLKRKFVGQVPCGQLLGAVTGQVPDEVVLPGLGRKKVTLCDPGPDLCQRCSRWNHKEWRCMALSPRCRYCAGRHRSDVCRDKIRRGEAVPPRCCNCGGAHNANSQTCPSRPRPRHATQQAPPGPPPAAHAGRPAPPPAARNRPEPLPGHAAPPAPGHALPNLPVANIGGAAAPPSGDAMASMLASLRQEIAALNAAVNAFRARLVAPGG